MKNLRACSSVSYDLLHNKEANNSKKYCQKQPQGLFYKKNVLKNFAKFTGKQLCQGLLFNKVAGLGVLKKKHGNMCFPVILTKFLRATFLQNTSGWVFLNYDIQFRQLKILKAWKNKFLKIFKSIVFLIFKFWKKKRSKPMQN